VFFTSSVCVKAADHPAFDPVKKLFAAMSAKDGDAMRNTCTVDFQLLEHGEEWDMDKLVKVVQTPRPSQQRENFFKQINARQIGNVAWVSYWNKAELHGAKQLRTIVWLESAVMIRIKDQWKIQLLHSTRVEPDKQPKDIQWEHLE